MKLMGDYRQRHKELTNKQDQDVANNRDRGLVNTILTRNSKSGTDGQTGRQAGTGTSWFAPQIKTLSLDPFVSWTLTWYSEIFTCICMS